MFKVADADIIVLKCPRRGEQLFSKENSEMSHIISQAYTEAPRTQPSSPTVIGTALELLPLLASKQAD